MESCHRQYRYLFDNAAAESWNATFKKELIHLRVWRNPGHVHQATFEYIEVYHNRKRIQKELGYLSPVEFEDEIDIGQVLAT
jgi:putative transposase